MFFKFGFEQLDQGECIGSTACKASEHLAVIELTHFTGGSLHHDIAMALSPMLLLLDEPMAGLSGQERDGLAALLRRTRQAGKKLVLKLI